MRTKQEILTKLKLLRNLLTMYELERRDTEAMLVRAKMEELEWVLNNKEGNPSKR